MPPTTEAARAEELAEALRALPVEIDAVDVAVRQIEVPSYPDEPRPTSVVTVRGGGASGRGEHVGWTIDAHENFARRAPDALGVARGRVAQISTQLKSALPDAYDRAALEAATIDLALRQSSHSLASLIGAEASDTRYVVSFAVSSDPARDVDETLADSSIGAKVDVAPTLDDEAFSALARTGRVAVIDWKRTGTPLDFERARRALPATLQEDPGPSPCSGSEAIRGLRSLDGPFTTAGAIEDLPQPAAANVKPARMGGVLEALDGVAYCARAGVPVYFGGMFELGPGRAQLLALASLLAPEGPNDIAPIPVTPNVPLWDRRLRSPEGPGFGDFAD